MIGTFYQNQLRKAFEHKTYLVEKVIRSRRKGGEKQHLGRWKGWLAKYETWISDIDFKKFK